MAKAKTKPTKTKASVNGQGVDKRPTVYFSDPTGERQKGIPVQVFYGLETSPKAQIDFMAHFMTDGPNGRYLQRDEALQILFHYDMGELMEMLEQLQASLNEGAFPKN